MTARACGPRSCRARLFRQAYAPSTAQLPSVPNGKRLKEEPGGAARGRARRRGSRKSAAARRGSAQDGPRPREKARQGRGAGVYPNGCRCFALCACGAAALRRTAAVARSHGQVGAGGALDRWGRHGTPPSSHHGGAAAPAQAFHSLPASWAASNQVALASRWLRLSSTGGTRSSLSRKAMAASVCDGGLETLRARDD